MKQEQLEQMLAKASKSVQALNRDISKMCPCPDYSKSITTPVNDPWLSKVKFPKTRIRQSSKPLMNKLETEWFEELVKTYGPGKVHVQAKKYKIGNNCWYCPDFTLTVKPSVGGSSWETAYEVKGKHAWEDSLVKLKVAASQWKEVVFILVWKDHGEWMTQPVLP